MFKIEDEIKFDFPPPYYDQKLEDNEIYNKKTRLNSIELEDKLNLEKITNDIVFIIIII